MDANNLLNALVTNRQTYPCGCFWLQLSEHDGNLHRIFFSAVRCEAHHPEYTEADLKVKLPEPETGSCRKCWIGGTGRFVGDKCPTPGCDGVIQPPANGREVWDPIPESEHMCPRRQSPDWPTKGPDMWEKHKVTGDRICSYCGGLHFDDFKALVDLCINSNGELCTIEVSDKKYKVYVQRPGIRNAFEGAIKFYHQHIDFSSVPETELPILNEAYRRAIQISNRLFSERLNRPVQE